VFLNYRRWPESLEFGEMKSLVFAVALTAVAFATSAAQASCVKAGGESTMLTEDLAKFMAKAALNNSIKNNGFKPSGQISLTCKPAPLGTHCVARQRACQ
jgi:hypothetical protein